MEGPGTAPFGKKVLRRVGGADETGARALPAPPSGDYPARPGPTVLFRPAPGPRPRTLGPVGARKPYARGELRKVYRRRARVGRRAPRGRSAGGAPKNS